MQRLELTLATPAENIALDEALLDWAEEDAPLLEVLRIWEPIEPIVVVGRSSRVEQEIAIAACRLRGIPVLRRSSGGAAIVAGPGCLMFAVVLSYSLRPELRDIHRAHCHVLGRLSEALRPHVAAVGYTIVHAGTSDLALEQGARSTEHGENPRKFSGNSLRAKRSHLLYHGTLLYDFDLSLVDTCLKMPPRQPDYRRARPHNDFVVNLPVERSTLIAAMDNAWPTSAMLHDWPKDRVAQLVAQRFGRDDWNLEFGGRASVQRQSRDRQ